jgi:hypothetical protein
MKSVGSYEAKADLSRLLSRVEAKRSRDAGWIISRELLRTETG